MSQTRVRHIEGSLRLVADVTGPTTGPAVLLAHGGGQTRGSWGTAVRLLADAGFWVWSLDLRGHGDSAWDPDGDYHVTRIAEDLATVLELVGRPAFLVGASLGGAAGLVAASQLGAQVRGLVLVDIVPRMRVEGVDRVKGFMASHPNGFASLEEAAAAIGVYLPHRLPAGPTPGLARNLREGEDGRYRWHWDPRLLLADTSLPETTALLEQAAAVVAAPTALVRGLQSDVVDDDGVRRLQEQIPALVVIDLPNAAHTAAADDNAAFADAVLTFLNTVIEGESVGPL